MNDERETKGAEGRQITRRKHRDRGSQKAGRDGRRDSRKSTARRAPTGDKARKTHGEQQPEDTKDRRSRQEEASAQTEMLASRSEGNGEAHRGTTGEGDNATGNSRKATKDIERQRKRRARATRAGRKRGEARQRLREDRKRRQEQIDTIT